MGTKEYRVEVKLRRDWYAGDRTQSDTELVVSGEGETPQEAFYKAFVALSANGLDPEFLLQEERKKDA